MNLSFLKKGDCVAVVAPAGRVNAAELQQGIAMLKEWGLNVIEGRYLYEGYGCFSATVEHRLSDLQWALDSEDVKAIVCARGGYGLVQLAEHIDVGTFLRHPKWIVGYSDVTVLHAMVASHNVPSLHAPMLRNIARGELSAQLSALYRQLLFGQLPSYTVASHRFNRLGEAQGVIVGGNLSVFAALRGTPLDYDYTDAILFIEDIGERAHCIDRMMYNLALGGVFDKIRGLIVGKFTDCKEDEGMMMSIAASIAKAVEPYSFPVLFDFPAGHVAENNPLLFGYPCRLKVSEQGADLTFE